MTKKLTYIGTFTGSNTGIIRDSHSFISAKKKDMTFCGNNTGTIERSFDVTEAQNVVNNNLSSIKQENTIAIHTKEQLVEIQQKINSGDRSYQRGNFQLMENIDMQGVNWSPIGISAITSFQGTFDGNGHSIMNLSVNGKKIPAAGFFGYIKNASIQNLHITGTVRGTGAVGIIAGIADQSTIESCVAKGRVLGKQYAAVFVGRNNGVISNCYAEGTIHIPSVLPVLTGTAASVLLLCTVFFFLNPKKSAGEEYFPPIPVDTGVIQIDNRTPKSGKNSISCDFDTRLIADENGMASIHFKNPGESNQHVIVEVQITDEELIEKLGTSGRTEEQMADINEAGTYEPSNYRVKIAGSGSVPPSYELETIQITELPDGTKLPAGEYQAIVYLSFYNIFSNQEAMLHTQSPVTLVIA